MRARKNCAGLKTPATATSVTDATCCAITFFRCYGGIGRQRRGGWPRAAQHATETADLLDEDGPCRPRFLPGRRGLQVPALAQLPASRRRNVLRYWIRERGFQTPATALLERISALVDSLPRTRQAEIRWGGVALHRYRDLLMLHPASLAPPAEPTSDWDGRTPLWLPAAGVQLGCCRRPGTGLARQRLDGASLQVRFRQGGERCQLPGRQHHHKLKKLLQAAGVPPWERALAAAVRHQCTRRRRRPLGVRAVCRETGGTGMGRGVGDTGI